MSSDEESYQVWHYGYHPRTLPCTADEPTCAYYDALWEGHDLTMIYSGVMWLVVGIALLGLALLRRTLFSRRASPFIFSRRAKSSEEASIGLLSPRESQTASLPSRSSRLVRAAGAASRAYLLPDSVRLIFGRTTRLQVLILVLLVTYLTVFSFIGITYALWTTEVADSPGVFKYQNSLGIWSNRIGALAYALTPFSVLLASRESILSALTGIPYQSFIFLHRWIGYIILIQGTLHAIAWTVICVGLYGPQPQYSIDWVTQEYMVYGLCAQFLIMIMVTLSFGAVIRITGFEFFRKSHYILAMIYIGTCWGHWEFIGDWMLCGLLLWFFDRLARLVRTAILHHQFSYGDWGFHPAQARVTMFPDPDNGDVVRLDYAFSQSPWKVGQHFYLCFPDLSVWQSHPFTPLSAPKRGQDGLVRHSYVLRAKSGETRKLAERAARRLASDQNLANGAVATPVIMQGPYGENSTEGLDEQVNILAVAGGTGISYVLPVLLQLIESPTATVSAGEMPTRCIQLVWMVRHAGDVNWVKPELDIVQKAASMHNIQITVYVTREVEHPGQKPSSGANDNTESMSAAEKTTIGPEERRPSSDISPVPSQNNHNSSHLSLHRLGGVRGDITDEARPRHPEVGTVMSQFVEQTIGGPTVVFASGPGGMISDLRTTVAALNSAAKVWRGDRRWDVELREDNRLEW